MSVQLMSPRLPGVKVLTPDATGPQYARWRRGVRNTFMAKGTWPHCDGTRPMPMPESGPNFFSPTSTTNPQPQLLEERRAWVKQDRDVKMDIFLSVADDIKLETFEVGPPLPPSSMTARDMIEALDERFGEFKFEDFHHAFCHFLNLHIDQYPSLVEFNAEFFSTLEDLLDHGFPLDNIQACSAYFSKLRCTQNPWVAKKLKEWDSLPSQPLLGDLMKECPPWMIIRPLTMKSSQTSVPDLYSENVMGPSSIKEEGEESSETEKSEATTASSTSSASHSRNPSTQSLKVAPSQPQETGLSHERTVSAQSQEITVHASVEDLHSMLTFPMPKQGLSRTPIHRARNTSSRSGMTKFGLPPGPVPINRPLPPLPGEKPRTRSNSPKSKSTTLSDIAAPPVVAAPEPQPKLTLTPPQIQKTNNMHPALRGSASAPTLETPTAPTPVTVTIFQTPQKRPSSSHYTPSPPNLAPPFAPEIQRRPSSSRGSPRKPLLGAHSTPETSTSSWTMLNRPSPLLRGENSNNSSIVSLPLQGATVPEYRDTVMGGVGNNVTQTQAPAVVLGMGTAPTTASIGKIQIQIPVQTQKVVPILVPNPSYLSASPPRSLMGRLSAELNDEDKKNRKRSWSLKTRLVPRRFEVKEMI